MDGENKGENPYFLMDDLGGLVKPPIFLVQHPTAATIPTSLKFSISFSKSMGLSSTIMPRLRASCCSMMFVVDCKIVSDFGVT